MEELTVRTKAAMTAKIRCGQFEALCARLARAHGRSALARCRRTDAAIHKSIVLGKSSSVAFFAIAVEGDRVWRTRIATEPPAVAQLPPGAGSAMGEGLRTRKGAQKGKHNTYRQGTCHKR